MRYAKIDKCEYVNGKECGVSLYVSGCHFHCKGCFNSEIWDFESGNLWNRRLTTQFLDCVRQDYVKRVSFLGGEPLANENAIGILKLIKEIKLKFPNKKIWVFTGYKFEDIISGKNFFESLNENNARYDVLNYIDVLVDGRFEIGKKDLTLAFRGSSNQRVIDVKKTLERHKIVLLEK